MPVSLTRLLEKLETCSMIDWTKEECMKNNNKKQVRRWSKKKSYNYITFYNYATLIHVLFFLNIMFFLVVIDFLLRQGRKEVENEW